MLSLMTYMKTSRSLVNIARSNYTAHSRLHKIERIERERERERERQRETEGGETKLEIIFRTKNPALVFAI